MSLIKTKPSILFCDVDRLHPKPGIIRKYRGFRLSIILNRRWNNTSLDRVINLYEIWRRLVKRQDYHVLNWFSVQIMTRNRPVITVSSEENDITMSVNLWFPSITYPTIETWTLFYRIDFPRTTRFDRWCLIPGECWSYIQIRLWSVSTKICVASST